MENYELDGRQIRVNKSTPRAGGGGGRGFGGGGFGGGRGGASARRSLFPLRAFPAWQHHAPPVVSSSADSAKHIAASRPALRSRAV